MDRYNPINHVPRALLFLPVFALLAAIALACGSDASGQQPTATSTQPAGSNPTPTGTVSPANTELKGTITLSGAFALYPLVIKWSEEFKKLHPDVQFDITAGGAGKGMTDVLGGLADLAMFSREPNQTELDKGAKLVRVAIDAVVPTANADNPFREQLLAKGLTRQQFADIYTNGTATDWKQLFPGVEVSGDTEISVYTRSDAAGAADVWAAYIDGKAQEDLLGIGVNADTGVAGAVQQDRLGIGYNNVGFAYDAQTLAQLDNLLVIPIDLNENGVIDPDENFYSARDQLTQAIADGIYPSPPARELTLVAKDEFSGLAEEFVRWVLTDGQAFVSDAGYVHVSPDKITAGLETLGQ